MVAKNPASQTPFPCGLGMCIYKGAMVLEPGPVEFNDYKSVFGYVSAITDVSPNDTGGPVQMSIVLNPPFKYGHSPEEWKQSWAWARINAFAPKADHLVSSAKTKSEFDQN